MTPIFGWSIIGPLVSLPTKLEAAKIATAFDPERGLNPTETICEGKNDDGNIHVPRELPHVPSNQ